MSITKETLEARLTEISQAIEQMTANVNAAVGRREEIKFQLQTLFDAEIKAKQEPENAGS